MEIEIKESKSLEDGKHTGIVDHIEYRDDPYKYTDVFIKEKETGFLLKYSCPTSISIDGTVGKSKLGRLLAQFTQLKAGGKADPEKILVGREVTFMTLTETTKEGSFVRIVDGSIKPIAEEQKVS